VRWTEAGVETDRTVFTPPDLAPENIIADIFIAFWPADMVREILPDGVTLDVAEDGGRTVRQGETVILTILQDAENPQRLVVRNEPLNYDLTIDSQLLE
jgi:hypothetical protein